MVVGFILFYLLNNCLMKLKKVSKLTSILK